MTLINTPTANGVLAADLLTTRSETAKAPYWNRALPESERIADLLGRMTLLEKARQLDLYMGEHFVDRMRNHTMMALDARFDEASAEALLGDAGVGAIHDLYPPTSEVPNAVQDWLRRTSRLGIPALFAEEALHGLCTPGNTAFPQSIGLASTWNPALIEKVGAVVGAEMRSANIHFAFGPVFDVARDPRWGRTEETYGEDAHLVARIGVAFIQGMQGETLASDHTAAAEPKHFAGHGAPEGGRNTAPLHAGPREMAETMLPPFEAAIRECGVLGIMCAYHEIDGVPCAANGDLLTGILRDQWGFEGMVLSDLGAIRLLLERHRVAADPADAVRQALTAGMDMQYYDFDHKVFEDAIIDGVESGKLTIEVVDQAVSRVLRLKFRLGLFENPKIDTTLAARVKLSAEHRAVNLQAARESICLLKNDGAALPLRKDFARIAVLGPNASQARSGDYSSSGAGDAISLLKGVQSAVSPATEVLFADGTGASVSASALPEHWLSHEGGAGLRAELFASVDMEADPLVRRVDSTIDFNWVAALPAAGMPVDGFSVRWSGTLAPDITADGFLSIPPQDIMHVWLDGDLVLSSWEPGAPLQKPISLVAGRSYALTVEYRKMSGGASVRVGWAAKSGDLEAAVALARSADVAIIALGEPPGISGEGMDRSNIDLPKDQMQLLKAVHATGTPVVVVLMNGRPLTINWAAEHIPAIVEAWYPAEVGGEALAEVLFGDYNPAGRLPVTFPKSIGQLPLTYDHKHSTEARYVDLDWRPLFPFGHGLSYTQFEYSNLEVQPVESVATKFTVSVTVTNTGERDGDEVVQLYLRDVVASVTTPVRLLKAFERIHLKAGEQMRLSFSLGHRELSLIDRNLNRVVEPGAFEVYVGGSSDATLTAEFRIVE
ncbi:glycoside hydrolase family 3 [Capsulimonas corticalis]|uniref:Glycoside hydrolase family 3 n=1 Tax=Capsulimonas corticalis TaxID=2219043 RepID=A0A402D6A9_9BACT|nr:glycoside hydrolase family 3 N-terminal domain-containing protein [Capsulimonas corticalis]BDI32032.1 glycoside hydrolase family 3 [Capsulimonas corticalis]